jgi:hypothetical protein
MTPGTDPTAGGAPATVSDLQALQRASLGNWRGWRHFAATTREGFVSCGAGTPAAYSAHWPRASTSGKDGLIAGQHSPKRR